MNCCAWMKGQQFDKVIIIFPVHFLKESTTWRYNAMKSWGYLAALINIHLRQKEFILFPLHEWKKLFQSCLMFCLQRRTNGSPPPPQNHKSLARLRWHTESVSCHTLALDQLQKADNGEDRSPWAGKHSMDRLNNPIFSLYSMWPI